MLPGGPSLPPFRTGHAPAAAPLRARPVFALVALAVGLLCGIAVSSTGAPALRTFANLLEPIGTIWLNAIRMTVIPMVVSLVIAGVASFGQGDRLGRLGLRTFLVFVVVLSVTAAAIAIVVPFCFRWLRIDAASVATLRAEAATVPASTAPTALRDWLLSMVPVNPIKAAVDSAMLPLFVCTLAFALALRRLGEAASGLLSIAEAVKQATLVMVGWILIAAPAGVFALALGLGTRLGAAAVGAIGYYVLVMGGLHLLVGLAMYPLAVMGGRIPLRRFAAAAAPAQIVAVTSRSSPASLPAMFEGAQRLGVPAPIAGFVLPLAISAFRLSSPVNWTIGALFVARLYGVPLEPAQIALVAAASVLLNPASPAIPSGGLFVQAPVYIAVGLPIEGLGILIAIDAIPDLFKTVLNVTADMAVVSVLGARS